MGLAFALAFAFVLLVSLARAPLLCEGAAEPWEDTDCPLPLRASEAEAPALYPPAETLPCERALDTSEADGVPALLPF